MGHSGRETEELVDETDFACHARMAEVAVTASDHAHDLEAPDGGGGCLHPLEATRWPDHALERTMIRFDDVVEILRGAMLDMFRQQPFVLQAQDRLGIRRQFIGRDGGRWMVAHRL